MQHAGHNPDSAEQPKAAVFMCLSQFSQSTEQRKHRLTGVTDHHDGQTTAATVKGGDAAESCACKSKVTAAYCTGY
jgi:hypothetical protein